MHEIMMKPAGPARSRAKASDASPGGGVSLGRWLGIDLRLESSWFVSFALLTFSLSTMLGAAHPELSTPVHWMVALSGSLLFFGSILTHEFAHSVVALRCGIRVRSITLHIFGGISRLGSEATRPRDEFLIAIVGPLTSAYLGLFFLGGSAGAPASVDRQLRGELAGRREPRARGIQSAPRLAPGRRARPSSGRLGRQGRRGPGEPGRSPGRRDRGLRTPSSGRDPGLRIPTVRRRPLAGTHRLVPPVGRSGRAQAVFREILGHLRVSDVMRAPVPAADPLGSIGSIVRERVLKTGERAFFLREGDRHLGWVTLREIKRVPRDEWDLTTLRDVMVPLGELAGVSPSDSLMQAFERLDEAATSQLPVLEDRVLVGMLSREDVLRLVGSHLELKAGSH